MGRGRRCRAQAGISESYTDSVKHGRPCGSNSLSESVVGRARELAKHVSIDSGHLGTILLEFLGRTKSEFSLILEALVPLNSDYKPKLQKKTNPNSYLIRNSKIKKL